MAKKNMILALVLSFIWAGLGLIYADDMQRGIILAVIALIAEILLRQGHQLFDFALLIIYFYSLYATYNQVKEINGEL